MGGRVTMARVPVYPVLMVVSLVVGWLVPVFYEWTGSDQSRMSPLVGGTAFGMLVLAAVVWAVLPWAPMVVEAPAAAKLPRVRFSSRLLLLLTAGLAVVVAIGVRFPLAVSGVFCIAALGHASWFFVRSRAHRWPTAALVACMVLPFVWLPFYDELQNLLPEALWIVAGLPAFLPAAFLGSLFGQNPHDTNWLAVLLTAAELTTGVWLVHLGPRRTIAYLVLVLLLSTFSSFVLNALVRA